MAKNAGIRVISDSGILQVDSSYRNFHLIGKKSAPHYYEPSDPVPLASGSILYQPKSKTSILAYGLDLWYPDVDPRTDAEMPGRDYNGQYSLAERFSQPLCMFRGRKAYDENPSVAGMDEFTCTTSLSKLVNIERRSSGPYYVYKAFNYFDSMPPKSANVEFSVYEFDLIDLSDSESTSGMQVFDGQGKLVFDANYKPMRVVKFFESEVYYDGEWKFPPNVWKLPQYNDGIKRKYAIAPLDAPLRFHNYYTYVNGQADDYVMSGGRYAVDYFQFQQTRILHIAQGVDAGIKTQPSRYLYSGMQTVNYLLLDVTGY